MFIVMQRLEVTLLLDKHWSRVKPLIAVVTTKNADLKLTYKVRGVLANYYRRRDSYQHSKK